MLERGVTLLEIPNPASLTAHPATPAGKWGSKTTPWQGCPLLPLSYSGSRGIKCNLMQCVALKIKM